MNRSLRSLAFAAIALAATFIASPQAYAANVELCAPNTSSAAAGPKRVVNPVTTTGYTLNGIGCAIFANADVSYFQSQGFLQPGPVYSIVYTTGALPASGTADIVGPSIPAGAYIQQIIWNNTTANAVTGGMSIGTTASGVDVVAAQALAANALVFTTDALLLKRVFSLTAATPLHFAPITSSNTANITVTIVYGYF